MRGLPRYLWAKNGWRAERRIAVAPGDLPEVTKHTATSCPFRTDRIVRMPSLDVRKRSPLARRSRSRYAFPSAQEPHRTAEIQPDIFGSGFGCTNLETLSP